MFYFLSFFQKFIDTYVAVLLCTSCNLVMCSPEKLSTFKIRICYLDIVIFPEFLSDIWMGKFQPRGEAIQEKWKVCLSQTSVTLHFSGFMWKTLLAGSETLFRIWQRGFYSAWPAKSQEAAAGHLESIPRSFPVHSCMWADGEKSFSFLK